MSSLLHRFRRGGIRVTVIMSRFNNASNVMALRSVLRRVINRVGSRCSRRRGFCSGLGCGAFVFRNGALLSSFYGVLGMSSRRFRRIRNSTSSLTNLLLRVGNSFPDVRRGVSCGGCAFRILGVRRQHVDGVGIAMRPMEGRRRGSSG